MTRAVRAAFLALALGLFASAPFAQQPTESAQKELDAAFAAARSAKQDGPSDVKLGGQVTFHVPEGFAFIPKAQALAVLKAMGNRPNPETTLGMIFPHAADQQWFATVRYIDSGYIKDDDAKEWKANEMLDQIKEGTEAANADRKARGLPEMQIVGWVEKPTYDQGTHRLVWSIESKDKGVQGGDNGINYNTFLLGREGYISLNFVTEMSVIESQKPIARQLLGSIEFEKGKTYAEFNSSTDRMAEYGLAALVGGVAAKKLGLFAIVGAFFAKFLKVFILGALAFGGAIWKFLSGKKDN
jgi:uncharacterized membrane-anchored protein